MWDGSELEVLRAIAGPLYARRRDQALASGAVFADVLAQTRTQPDVRLCITAAFLAGWQEDRDRFHAFERDLAAIDFRTESLKVPGIGPAVERVVSAARREHGERLLPFCWEAVIKLGELLPDYKRMAFFGYIADVQSESSIEPLLWCVDEAADPEIRDGAHQTLVAHLGSLTRDRLKAGRRPHHSRDFVYEDLLQRLKIAGKKKG